MQWSDFAGPVCAGLSAKYTPTNSQNMWGQCSQEKTGLHPAPSDFVWYQWFNPLNTTQRMPGSTSVNSVGVQAYSSLAQGIQATIATLLDTVPGVLPYGYNHIVQAYRENLPAQWWDGDARHQLDIWGTGSIWCDYTPMGEDTLASLNDIYNQLQALNYALLWGRGTANVPPAGSAYAAANFDGRLDAAIKPVLEAVGKITVTGGTGQDLTPIVQAAQAAAQAASDALVAAHTASQSSNDAKAAVASLIATLSKIETALNASGKALEGA